VLELKVYDDETEVVLQFEHSLRSLSKWESKNKKPFMSSLVENTVELIEYYQDMLLTPVDPSIIYRLSPEQLDQLSKYINTSQTASTVPKPDKKGPTEIVTSELIYYWMTILKINWEAQDWHLTRLMVLIEITNFKAQPEKKKSKAEMLKSWHEINERNKKRFGIEG
jgi:hypothetical protein